jgi:hypothetical protein
LLLIEIRKIPVNNIGGLQGEMILSLLHGRAKYSQHPDFFCPPIHVVDALLPASIPKCA